ncbi:MAG: hypothetical protein N3G80_00595 [Candidatus Micrarchaeota archaeon]|nr:hypothetical protein [Candidatus Micrarchaeota archaeon]
MPWEQKKAVQEAPAAEVEKQAPPRQENASQENQTVAETVVKKNKTSAASRPVELPPDPFASFIPRNISDRIADGQFRIYDMPGAPLNIYVIDAGEGDAVLVIKGNFYMLVDAGNAEKILSFLEKMQIKNLNVLVITRNAPEAINGAAEVLERIEVGEIWENNATPGRNLVSLTAEEDRYAEIIEKAKDMGIAIKRPQAGDSIVVSGMEIKVLNPQATRFKGNPDVDAIVLKLSFNNFCMLLLHPTVQDIESILMGADSELGCPVITYFKHGEGRPLPSLLVERYPPEHAIISVGKEMSGLPSPTTIERLLMKKIKVWRTDVDGTIRIYSDGYMPYEIMQFGNRTSN